MVNYAIGIYCITRDVYFSFFIVNIFRFRQENGKKQRGYFVIVKILRVFPRSRLQNDRLANENASFVAALVFDKLETLIKCKISMEDTENRRPSQTLV